MRGLREQLKIKISRKTLLLIDKGLKRRLVKNNLKVFNP